MDAGRGKPARSGHDSPNAKGNFDFERIIPLDRCACVLDLRRKR
jgi:hypothetical protein